MTPSASPPYLINDVEFGDPPSVERWRAGLRASAGQRVAEAMARFKSLGLADEEGRIVERGLPDDMRPGLKTSVAT